MHTENSECTHIHTCSLHENYTLRTHDLVVATKLAFLYEEPNRETRDFFHHLWRGEGEGVERERGEGGMDSSMCTCFACAFIELKRCMYVAARVVTDRQIDIHIHKASTVTLAVHAHRGLITTYTACAHHYRLYTAHIIHTLLDFNFS